MINSEGSAIHPQNILTANRPLTSLQPNPVAKLNPDMWEIEREVLTSVAQRRGNSPTNLCVSFTPGDGVGVCGPFEEMEGPVVRLRSSRLVG